MPTHEATRRAVSGQALDEANELLRLQRLTRPQASDPERIQAVLMAFGWQQSALNTALLYLFVLAARVNTRRRPISQPPTEGAHGTP